MVYIIIHVLGGSLVPIAPQAYIHEVLHPLVGTRLVVYEWKVDTIVGSLGGGSDWRRVANDYMKFI